MISSWARICKILGNQFEPYLPYVMGSVLKAASIKIEVALLDRKHSIDAFICELMPIILSIFQRMT